MKIVWRNPNAIDRTSFSIVKTPAAEQPDELRVFYRSSRGPEALGTILSYSSIVTRSLARDNPSVNHAITVRCRPAALPDSKIGETLHSSHYVLEPHHVLSRPLQAGKGIEESQSRCKGKA
jgi:hypothetical protein